MQPSKKEPPVEEDLKKRVEFTLGLIKGMVHNTTVSSDFKFEIFFRLLIDTVEAAVLRKDAKEGTELYNLSNQLVSMARGVFSECAKITAANENKNIRETSVLIRVRVKNNVNLAALVDTVVALTQTEDEKIIYSALIPNLVLGKGDAGLSGLSRFSPAEKGSTKPDVGAVVTTRLEAYVRTSTQAVILCDTLEARDLTQRIGVQLGLDPTQLSILEAACLADDLAKLHPDVRTINRYNALLEIVDIKDKARGIEKIKANEIVAEAKKRLASTYAVRELTDTCCFVWTEQMNRKLEQLGSTDRVDAIGERAVIEEIAAHEIAAANILAREFPEIPAIVRVLVASHHDGSGLAYFAKEYGVDAVVYDLKLLMSVLRVAHAFHAAKTYGEKPQDTLNFVIGKMLVPEQLDRRAVIVAAALYGLKVSAEENQLVEEIAADGELFALVMKVSQHIGINLCR